MPRTSIVAEIFGYLVCLLTVIVFFASVAGLINGAFRIAHPTPQPSVTLQRFVAQRPGAFWGGGPMMQAPALPPSGPNARFVRNPAVGDERYDATRRFVVSAVMLVLSIVVFNRAFGWLNPRQSSVT